MLLAQGRYWRITLAKGAGTVSLGLLKDPLSEDLRDLKIDVPLPKWNRVAKYMRSDRKLLGGILLDFARRKDLVSTAIANDRLFEELQRVAVDATAALIESGALSLTIVEVGAD